jgi:hypothetical protein
VSASAASSLSLFAHYHAEVSKEWKENYLFELPVPLLKPNDVFNKDLTAFVKAETARHAKAISDEHVGLVINCLKSYEASDSKPSCLFLYMHLLMKFVGKFVNTKKMTGESLLKDIEAIVKHSISEFFENIFGGSVDKILDCVAFQIEELRIKIVWF